MKHKHEGLELMPIKIVKEVKIQQKRFTHIKFHSETIWWQTFV